MSEERCGSGCCFVFSVRSGTPCVIGHHFPGPAFRLCCLCLSLSFLGRSFPTVSWKPGDCSTECSLSVDGAGSGSPCWWDMVTRWAVLRSLCGVQQCVVGTPDLPLGRSQFLLSLAVGVVLPTQYILGHVREARRRSCCF